MATEPETQEPAGKKRPTCPTCSGEMRRWGHGPMSCKEHGIPKEQKSEAAVAGAEAAS